MYLLRNLEGFACADLSGLEPSANQAIRLKTSTDFLLPGTSWLTIAGLNGLPRPQALVAESDSW